MPPVDDLRVFVSALPPAIWRLLYVAVAFGVAVLSSLAWGQSRSVAAAVRPEAGVGQREMTVRIGARVSVDGNPFAGASLYVNPSSHASRQADAWRSTRPADAALMDRIASRPQAEWFGDWDADVRAAVDRHVSTVVAAGALPVLVAYAIPDRDCSGHSAGGMASLAAYRAWIRAFAEGIGSRRAVVVLEPDALAAIDCLRQASRAARAAALRDAIGVLAARRRIAVYVDAGHSAWVDPAEIGQRLNSIGIARARGFALNVSNFRPTAELVAYGRRVSAAIGGKPFVLDTSRNGLGAAADGSWCNPPGRALGADPAVPGDRSVDAYLWIKRPGQSDGPCNGGPPAGSWWPDYALGLARRAP